MLPTGNHRVRSGKCDGSGGAGSANVNAGDALLGDRLHHFVGMEPPPHPPFEPRARRDEPLDVAPAEAGVLERGVKRVERQLKLRLVRPFAPGVSTGAEDVDLPAHRVSPSSGANA